MRAHSCEQGLTTQPSLLVTPCPTAVLNRIPSPTLQLAQLTQRSLSLMLAATEPGRCSPKPGCTAPSPTPGPHALLHLDQLAATWLQGVLASLPAQTSVVSITRLRAGAGGI